MMRFHALLLLVGLMGCPGGHETDSNDSDTSDNAVTYNVTLNWSIDGVVQDDPVPVSLHSTEGETGYEALLTTGETGEAIPVTVPKDDEQVRAWIGPESAEMTSDGHRILEHNGIRYVHPFADFLVEEDHEEVIAVNQMPILEGMEYDCETQKYYYNENAKGYRGEFYETVDGGVHALHVTDGATIANPEDPEWGGDDETLINRSDRFYMSGSRIMLQSTGTTLFLQSSEILEESFTASIVKPDVLVYDLTCTLVE